MPVHNIVVGQKVKTELVERAKEFRRKMTPEEKMLWRCLRDNQLGGFHFRRQQVIYGYLADFYCHAAALVVEVDGPIHEEQHEHDAGRDEASIHARLSNLAIQERTDSPKSRRGFGGDLGRVSGENLTPGPFPAREGERRSPSLSGVKGGLGVRFLPSPCRGGVGGGVLPSSI